MTRITNLIAVLAALLVQGCGIDTPTCSDERTVGLIKQIFRRSLEELLAAKELEPSLAEQTYNHLQLRVTTITTNDDSEKPRKLTCQAFLEVDLPAKGINMVNMPSFRAAMANDPATSGIEVSGSVIRHDIHYTSRVTDDGNEHVVEMIGHAPLVEVAIALGANDFLFGDPKDVPSGTPNSAAERSEIFPDLTRYLDRPPTDVLREAVVAKTFRDLLGNDYPGFIAGLATSDGLRLIGDYYIGAGCAPHVCSIEEAAFAIHQTTGKSYAVRLIDGNVVKNYGTEDGHELPGPLREWYSDHGHQY